MKLKVLTLNLWHGGRLMDGVLDFLESQAADVVFLQEAYNSESTALESRFRSLETIRSHLNYKNTAFAPLLVDKFHEADAPIGNAILSNFPITPGKTDFFNEPFWERDPYIPETIERIQTMPRILQHAVLSTPEGDIDLFNVHGVWDLQGENFSQRRRNMRDIILRAIDGKPNVILAGDTNARPTNEMWEPIEEKLHSVFGNQLTSTFNMKHKTNPGYATAVVDMIFVSKNIKVLEKDCHDVDISDHLPLTAALEI